MKTEFPFGRVNWVTSIFLIVTAFLALTAVPWFVYKHGLDWFYFGWFFFYFVMTGLSITLGFHRYCSHKAFKASLPVRLMILLFGSAAFQNSALDWSSDHRRHHKHVDHDEDDPYSISKGFFYAHIGWMLFKLKPQPPMDNVADLRKDPILMFQHRHNNLIGVIVGFLIPTLLGYWHQGWIGALGGLLIIGVARIVLVQQSTFCINSVAHSLGKRPYSTKCSARDSAWLAFLTFGEGYHNFHHEFQHDYRNGVKPWHFDPTKWSIWFLNKIGLASDLRRVSDEKILLAEISEAQKQIQSTLNLNFTQPVSSKLQSSIDFIKEASQKVPTYFKELQDKVNEQVSLSKQALKHWKREMRAIMHHADHIHSIYHATMPGSPGLEHKHHH